MYNRIFGYYCNGLSCTEPSNKEKSRKNSIEKVSTLKEYKKEVDKLVDPVIAGNKTTLSTARNSYSRNLNFRSNKGARSGKKSRVCCM